jgi:SAM-dependent methyltransferase/uncharacterized protein YbaR (Trm112 family)
MREILGDRLRCPVDLAPLNLDILAQDSDGQIMDGHLECSKCQRVYTIEQGVPCLLPAESVHVDGSDLGSLQTDTVERFGFEWQYFGDWGWLADYPSLPDANEKFYGGLVEHTRSAFWSKLLFQKEDLQPGLAVLDAGCGNGRFTYLAAQTGAEIIGLDLGWGVRSAFAHTRALPNVHIVRADIFRLPFADRTFDRIFTIGVLQHTGNAKTAFDSLVRVLRRQGLIVAHVYGQGRLTYEIIDALIRRITTRLPIKLQMKFARLTASLTRWLKSAERRKRFYNRLYSHVNLLPTEHHMYDWWSAPIATHHTENEVREWFANNELEILRTNPPLNDAAALRSRRIWHGAITVLGRSPRRTEVRGCAFS